MSMGIRLENGKSVEVEIAKCEASLQINPNNLDILLQLAELYMMLGKRSKITYYVVACLKQYLTSPTAVEKGMVTVNIALRFWRAEKYVNRENLR